jgi:predicted RNA-binding protein
MFYKYRYVKVRFEQDDQDYFAYERTFLGIFKSYLCLNSMITRNWHGKIDQTETYLYRPSLKEVKSSVKKRLKKFTVEITDAETKLDRHLGGDE